MAGMLRIDRVKTEMEILPSGDAAGRAPSTSATSGTALLLSDPQARERLKEMVLEVLRDHLRSLERRGVV
jgi:hypothetical protein